MMHKRAPFLIFICCAATALAVLAQEAVRPADRPSQPVPKAQSPAAPPPQVAGTVQLSGTMRPYTPMVGQVVAGS